VLNPIRIHIKNYYHLTKPGIIRGNLITALAGFLLASQGHIDFWLLLATLAGISLIIASACVFNNYIDRNIDKKMARTKKRALVTGLIAGRNAMLYATTLGVVGFGVLAAYTNFLTVLLGLIAIFSYVVLYGFAKRRSVHGTLVGTLPGALPPVAGYTAAMNQLDAAAIILFLILVFWQMPHFYAIAMYRFDDYKAAGVPVLPVKKGMKAAKVQILLYIVAFIIACAALAVYGYGGDTYLVVSLVLGYSWLYLGVKGFKTADDKRWARKMFGFSLLVISLLSLVISLNAWLP
jgi:protoheme IX farnesyltransferase